MASLPRGPVAGARPRAPVGGSALGTDRGPRINIDGTDAGRFRAVVPIAPISKEAVDAAAQKVSGRDREIIAATTQRAEDEMTPLTTEATRMYPISFEELKERAACVVNVPATSGRGSCNDSRLGVLADDEVCGTCFETNMDCVGHEGIIILNRWFLNPTFAELAIRVLQCVCNSCGGLLIDRSTIESLGLLAYRDVVRLQKLAEHCEKLRCTRHLDSGATPAEERRQCVMNPTYSPSKTKDSYIVMYEYNDKAIGKITSERTMQEIDQIFSRISEEDMRLMGMEEASHPRNFILKGLPVIPPSARPHVIQDGEIKHDYFTTSYGDIVRCNNRLLTMTQAAGGAPEKGCAVGRGCVGAQNTENDRRCVERNLYFYISHFMNNRDGKYTRSADEPILSVRERLKEKDGYIRGLSMGKRVDFSGRSVLGSRRLRFGQVGCPKRMGRVLTTPIRVTRRNRVRLLKEYVEGRVSHLTPGSGDLRGRRFQINDRTRERYHPQIGDLLYVWSKNGAKVSFNRQPTLHKQSIMGNEAVYHEEETIGLHSSVTTPHNADFDGDEGNIHHHQSIEAQVEASKISDVGSCVMNAQANRPMMGMVYNSISSAYMMSNYTVTLDEDDWQEAMTNLDDDTPLVAGANATTTWASHEDRCKKHGVNPRSPAALFSTVLPPDFYYNSANIKIRDGILKQGVLTKKHVGPAANSIVHVLWKMYSKARVSRFFTECQFMCDWFIEIWGLSIGYADCTAPNANQVADIINKELGEAQLKIDGLGAETADMSPIEKDYREKQVRSFLDNVAAIGQKIGLQALAPTNPLNIMANSGAKGNETNTAQIVGLLAQQFVKGQRPKMEITGNTRVLPYFEPNSTDIEARGFIFENFMRGVKPAGMFFHLMASRIGLIDTAIKTADTGHLHHRINKSCEDIIIGYDGSVRNAQGVIFQYCFSDGFGAGELIPTKSSALGDVVSFIDLATVIGRLNLSRNFDYY